MTIIRAKVSIQPYRNKVENRMQNENRKKDSEEKIARREESSKKDTENDEGK